MVHSWTTFFTVQGAAGRQQDGEQQDWEVAAASGKPRATSALAMATTVTCKKPRPRPSSICIDAFRPVGHQPWCGGGSRPREDPANWGAMKGPQGAAVILDRIRELPGRVRVRRPCRHNQLASGEVFCANAGRERAKTPGCFSELLPSCPRKLCI